jgi:hypothetical protein
MTLYIATDIHGDYQRSPFFTTFADKADFFNYASEVLACCDNQPKASDTIAEICDTLADQGMGRGSRHHYRITGAQAYRM